MRALREESRTAGVREAGPHLNSPRSIKVHPTFYICCFGGLVGREEGRMAGASAGLEGGGNSGGLRPPAAGGAGGQATPVLGQVLTWSALDHSRGQA